VLIGASAGGIEPLRRIIAALPADFPAAIVVTVHVPAQSRSALPMILAREGKMQAVHARTGDLVLPGKILIAPPDHHLIVEGDRVRLTRGPRENGHRPAVDPMFRTGARSWRRRAIGLVLSGALDDGAAGMVAVSMFGGVSMVQSPEDAEHAGMPQSVMDAIDVDHVLPASRIAATLVALTAEDLPDEPGGSAAMAQHDPQQPEDESSDTAPLQDSRDDREGTPSGFTCPDCSGALWEKMEGRRVHFRCRVGHAYSPRSLLAMQGEGVEEALWTAYRALEESASMARRMASRLREQGFPTIAAEYDTKLTDALDRARLIRSALDFASSEGREPPESLP
jgi:two-component system chemotaxis response regulator CheB